MPLEVFAQRNFAVDFIRKKANFIHQKDKFAFLKHFLGYPAQTWNKTGAQG